MKALEGGKSLLPSGIVAVSGDFGKGDSVRLLRPDGGRLGVGLANYAAEEIALIRGRHSDEIEGLLGYRGPAVVIHRDDLVLEHR
ncbi:Glutamate 5-kinase [compost metagenome]